MKARFDVGRYRVLQKLSTGGMAEVFLGQQLGVEGFAKPVVIKSILPELAHDKEFRAMLVNEARLAALLRHANLVQVLDLVVEGDRYWVVMEQIEGYTLHALLNIGAAQGATLEPGVVCRIICSVLAGLSYAHCLSDAQGHPLGLVHRDISPTNIIVGNSGDARVIDFGIAKATLKLTAKLTQTGHLKGKSSYMSPEQVRGDSVDARADVFSVGTVMWEALTMSRLFKRASPAKSMAAIVFEAAPPPSSKISSLPRELDRILAMALAKDPAQRYLSAQAMREDLEDLIVDQRWRASTLEVQRTVETLTSRGGPSGDRGEDTARSPAPSLAGERAPPSWSDDDFPAVGGDDALPEIDVVAPAPTESAPAPAPSKVDDTAVVAPDAPPTRSRRPRLVLLAALLLVVAAAAAALVLHPDLLSGL